MTPPRTRRSAPLPCRRQEGGAWSFNEAEDTGRDSDWTNELVRELKRSMPPDALLGLALTADDTVLELRLLRVSIDHRGQGHATRVLTRPCAEADARGLILACTPTDEFGADTCSWRASTSASASHPSHPSTVSVNTPGSVRPSSAMHPSPARRAAVHAVDRTHHHHQADTCRTPSHRTEHPRAPHAHAALKAGRFGCTRCVEGRLGLPNRTPA